MPDLPDYVHSIYTSVKNTWQDAENLDDEHGYVTYIWIPEETYKVDIMKLHIFSEKFRAFSKSALDGGAVVKTSSEGGAATPTSSEGGAEVPTTTEEGNHKHMIGSITGTPPEPDGKLVLYNAAEQSIAEMPLNILVAGQSPWTFGTYGEHTHDVTITNHTHTVTIANHTHSVTLIDHTHEIEYGIYEEAITGRTLSAILYDPDGNELEDFGVVLTGEDSDILDLTDHFEDLQYGMYKLVLSASGRLRARMVFYELCKMYAQY